MATCYELWDLETRNLLGTYDTKEAALAVVRGAIRAHGPGIAETLFLGYETSSGHTIPVAQARSLIELAGATQNGGSSAGWMSPESPARVPER